MLRRKRKHKFAFIPKDFILTESRKATLNKLVKLRRVAEATHPPLAENFDNEKRFKPLQALFCRFGARNALLYGIYCKFANARTGGNYYEMLSQQKITEVKCALKIRF